jgi:hypothetical protein
MASAMAPTTISRGGGRHLGAAGFVELEYYYRPAGLAHRTAALAGERLAQGGTQPNLPSG